MDKKSAWDSLSYEQQKRYLERHPGSRRKINKSPDGGKVDTAPEKKPDWKELERKVVDKAKKMEHPAPTSTPSFDPHEIGKQLERFNPAADEHDRWNMSSQRDQHDVMNGEVTIGIRDLGRWENPEDKQDEEDYDWQEWAPGEGDRYMKKFQNWLSNQKWFDPNKMEPFLHTGEKNWAYFGIRNKK